MHSRIFEISAEPIDRNGWKEEHELGDDWGRIDGVDYLSVLDDPEDRRESIRGLFKGTFPEGAFGIVKDEPDRTASVMFTGNAEDLKRKWAEGIQAAAARLTQETMDGSAVFRVMDACERPFGTCAKFCIDGWNGCPEDAHVFLWWLIGQSAKNDGKPFAFYVGQVFDYHF